jgi:hypothetical protein
MRDNSRLEQCRAAPPVEAEGPKVEARNVKSEQPADAETTTEEALDLRLVLHLHRLLNLALHLEVKTLG